MSDIPIVVGLGFGDEGKGRIVDQLSDKNTIVVRFSGGQQAGHTVYHDGKHHVFASFGSGTFRAAATFWSKYCPFYPNYYLNELAALESRGVRPIFYIDEKCPLVTHYDILWNKMMNHKHADGTTGMGQWATIERHKIVKLEVADLRYPVILRHKLKAIEVYYTRLCSVNNLPPLVADIDIDPYLEVLASMIITNEEEFFTRRQLENHNLVFEGSQGILLDMDYGIYPHVTSSNTTIKNAISIIERNCLGNPFTCYVTRSYLTRHGNGPIMSTGYTDIHIPKVSKYETNVTNAYQGEFRTAWLDWELLNYSLSVNRRYYQSAYDTLCITHMDNRELLHVVQNGVVDSFYPKDITTRLGFGCCYTSTGPEGKLKQITPMQNLHLSRGF